MANPQNLTESLPSRSKFWDFVRGIGILSIVLGHSWHIAIPFVYPYHLAVFFFVSGFLYQEKKYGTSPFTHIGAKLKSSWPKYAAYMSLFALLHNLFQAAGINPPGNFYSKSQVLLALGNTIVFQGIEVMGGALWFVPVWVLSCGIFGGVVWFALCLCKNRQGVCSLLVGVVCSLFGITGTFMIFRGLYLSYMLHLSFLVQPFFAAGWLLKRHLPNFRLWLKWYAALFCAVLLGIYVLHRQLYINIAEGRIGNGWEYFFLAFLGIYCCMYLSFLLEKSGRISGIVSLWGRYSFDIMALHFLIFKVLDLLCGILKKDPLEVYSAFPQAYSSLLWPLYAVLGTTIPAFLGFLLETAKKKKLPQ